MELHLDDLQAKKIIEEQLAQYINTLKKVQFLFSEGSYQSAYNKFPYHDKIGDNLEIFIDQRDKSKPV